MEGEGDRRQSGTAASGAEGTRAPERKAVNMAAKLNEVPSVKSRGTEFVSQIADRPPNGLLSERWFVFAPCFAITLLFIAGISRTVPDTGIAVLGLLAIGLASASPLFMKLEHHLERKSLLAYAIMLLGVGLPALSAGFAIALWRAQSPAFGWDLAIAAVAVLCLCSASYLRGRLISQVVANVALWSGTAICFGSPMAIWGLGLGAIGGLIIIKRSAGRATKELELEIERERAQRRAVDLLSEYEATGHGWFWETDRQGRIAYVSPRIAKLLGTNPSALVGKPFADLFILSTAEKESERTLKFHLSTRSSFQDLSVLAATREAEERWWSVSGRPVLDNFNNFLGFRGWGSDLTEHRKSQQHVTELARFDSLTKLANRFQMSEWLEKILNAPREDNRLCSVFLLDLDRFKQVNDFMGHPAGDALLKQVSERLSSTVGQAGRVGRLGGDEFQVILPGRVPQEDLGHLGQRIIDNLSQPYSVDGQRVTIGASVGIAVYPSDGKTSEELIRNADLALYAAKDGGRGRYHFYAGDLHSEAQERQQLEQDLRDAIAAHEFELYYQPQVHTTTEKVSGFEALIRWKHPELGDLPPSKFIPIAEDTGLIAQIGEWVLRTACADLARWPESIRVAVNVSALQFANPALPAIVTNAVASTGIDPSRLELEITESVFLNDDKATAGMFSALKAIGVRLALDDFGTGYSSLGYLKKAPFDKIKIDQSFVRGATVEGSRNGAIIPSIVNLAEALGMETTAEGVETLDELDLMRQLGCSHIQGFIYDHSLPVEEAEERLESGMTAIAQGPRSARAPRQTMLRKVVLEHGQHKYNGTIRNISTTGAMVEGLWNVPAGTEFSIHLSKGYSVKAVARWSKEDRMGVEFAEALELDDNGGVSVRAPRRRGENVSSPILRKAG